MKTVTYNINEFNSNQTIKDFFQYANLSSKMIHLLKMAKAIKLNDNLVNDTAILKENDILEINFDSIPTKPIKPSLVPIDIIYEDDDIVVVNKPTGCLTHQDESDFDSLTNRVNGYYQQKQYAFSVLPAHRIDYDTSGMVIFGKHPISLAYLSHLFESREIVKTYQAIIEGDFPKKRGVIHKKIAQDRHSNKMRVSNQGKDATSIYQFIKKNLNDNLVEIEIIGGRKHQIRVHMASINYPIKGDILYGKESDRLYLHFYKVNMPKFRFKDRLEIELNAPFSLE